MRALEKQWVEAMDITEIRDLYAEELALLKRIQSFWKEPPQADLKRIDKVTRLLLHRLFSNLYSALVLTTSALKSKEVSLYQLPIGILLRCCFTDCLFALYIQRIDEEKACEDLDLRTVEYANSLLERREVYRDQVKSTGIEFDDSFIDYMWELMMEDNFLHVLSFDESKTGLEVTKQSKTQLQEAGFSKTKSIGVKEQKDFLIKQNGLETLATRLYHYYKYFSQYEHFSENGQGDVLVSTKEDGNDNIHFPSAIRALSEGVEEIIKWRGCVCSAS